MLAALLFYLSPWLSSAAEIVQSDVCIYGGTAAGVAAAVEAARSGKTAVIAEFGDHLGGMSSGGLSQTDIGNKGAIGGIAREFYQRVGQHYGKPEQWTFEPGVAENIFFDLVNDARTPVYFQQRLAAVKKEGRRIVEITMENGKIYRAKMFIDASYEGDLMARAKVSYTVGREGNSQYDETLNGIRAETPKHQFLVAVDPCVKAGDPQSGLLPFVQPGDGDVPGSGDRAVQAYNFRLCLTRNPLNQRSIAPPANYDPARYELLARYIEGLVAAGKPPKLGDLMHIQMMPNGETDINNDAVSPRISSARVMITRRPITPRARESGGSMRITRAGFYISWPPVRACTNPSAPSCNPGGWPMMNFATPAAGRTSFTSAKPGGWFPIT